MYGMNTSDVLSMREVEQLRRWRRRYVLESEGWTPDQARRLVFLAWLYQTGRLTEVTS